MATSAQREWAGREVKEPRSQACWLGAASGELGGPWSHLEATSELCLDQETTHSGRWRGLGEADTEVNLPAVLCKTPLSSCTAAATRQRTPTAALQSPAPSAPGMQAPGTEGVSTPSLKPFTVAAQVNKGGYYLVCWICLNKSGRAMGWWEQ